MFSPRRIVLYALLFIFIIFGFFHLVLPTSSYFYDITPAPTTTKTITTSTAMSPTNTPTPEITSPTPTVTLPALSREGGEAGRVSYYTVQSGDTLEAIANKYNISWIDLANLNQITDPNFLTVGQIIKVSANPEDYKNADPYYKTDIYQAAENEKHILIVLSEQKLYTYEGDKLLNSYLISSGVAAHPTVTGIFKVWIKLESTTMSGEGYYLTKVPYTMYFYGDYGIHGTYWHNNFGTPMSHGCINMATPDAEAVFNWAEVGTIVQVIP